jgi:hypothetical protein
MWIIFTEENYVDFETFPFLKDFHFNTDNIYQSVKWLITDKERENIISNLMYEITRDLWKLLRAQKKYYDTYNKWTKIINKYIENPLPPLKLWTINIELEEHLSSYICRYYKIIDFKLTKILNKIYNKHFDTKDFLKEIEKIFWKDHEISQNYNNIYKKWLKLFLNTRRDLTHHTKNNDDLYFFDWLKLYTDSVFIPEIKFWDKKIETKEFMQINTTNLINFCEELIVDSLETLLPKSFKIFINKDWNKEIWQKYIIVKQNNQ